MDIRSSDKYQLLNFLTFTFIFFLISRFGECIIIKENSIIQTLNKLFIRKRNCIVIHYPAERKHFCKAKTWNGYVHFSYLLTGIYSTSKIYFIVFSKKIVHKQKKIPKKILNNMAIKYPPCACNYYYQKPKQIFITYQ